MRASASPAFFKNRCKIIVDRTPSITFTALRLHAKQLVHPLKSRNDRGAQVPCPAPCETAPSRAFLSSIPVFHIFRGLPLIARTFFVIIPFGMNQFFRYP